MGHQSFIAPPACKKENRAAGEVSRNWMPTQQQKYMGVAASDARLPGQVDAETVGRTEARPLADQHHDDARP